MKKKEQNIVYLAIGAIAAYYLYKYFKNKPVTTTTTTEPVILNQSKLETPAEQVSAPIVATEDQAKYSVRYKINGFKIPQTL